jgi:hypothetical protein
MNKDELIVRQVAIKGAIELVIADKDNGTDMFELAQSIQDWVLEPFESENVSQQKPFSETAQPPAKTGGGNATDKQLGFIYKLLKEVPMSVSSVAQEKVDNGLSGVGASDLIKSLLAEKEKAEPKAKAPANDFESPF